MIANTETQLNTNNTSMSFTEPFLAKFAQDMSQISSNNGEQSTAQMGTYLTKVNGETTDDR